MMLSDARREEEERPGATPAVVVKEEVRAKKREQSRQTFKSMSERLCIIKSRTGAFS